PSAEGRLLRREPAGFVVTHADLGRPGWIDIVIDGRGNAYVNRADFNQRTADNSTLIVAGSYRHQLVGFDIAADGVLSGRPVWAALGEGTPDGICADPENAGWDAGGPHHCSGRPS